LPEHPASLPINALAPIEGTPLADSPPLDGLEFDLNDFITDAVTKSYGLTSSMYLSIVFGGFEIWGGADGIQLSQFCVTVN